MSKLPGTFILGVSAKKQAGKSTLCEGLLKIFPSGMVQIYSFADTLKNFCTDVLGLRHEQVWGSDADKNTLTDYKWDNFSMYIRWMNGSRRFACGGADQKGWLLIGSGYAENVKNEEDFVRALQEGCTPWPMGEHRYLNGEVVTRDPAQDGLRSGMMTAREVMQVLGTDVMRNMFDQNIWAKSLFRRIQKDKPAIAMVPDVRFPTELTAIIENGGWVVRLTRNVLQDLHASETALDNYNWDQCGDRAILVPPLGIVETRQFVSEWLITKVGADPSTSPVVKEAMLKI